MRPVSSPQRLTLLVAGLILVIAACSPSAQASPTPTPTPTSAPTVRPTPSPSPTASPSLTDLPLTGRIELPGEGYALTLPDGWFRAAMTEEDLRAMMELGDASLPDGLSELMKSQAGQWAVKGMSLMAFREMSDGIPLGTSANVLSMPSFGLTIDMMDSVGSAQVSAMLGIDVEVTTARITLPAGEAIVVTYSLPMQGATPMTVAARQYVLIGARRQFVISCATPGTAEAIRAECDAIAESFEFLP
jgi:hypothetical protein